MKNRRFALAVAVSVAVAACSASTTRDTEPRAESATNPASPPVAPVDPIVVAISVDGLNPDAINALGRDGAPHLWRLIDEGASTFNARTAYGRTSTLPNHTGMVTGRHVNDPGGTGVTFNNDNGSTLAEVHGSYVPSMFDVAHDAGLTTALFAEKDKFRFLVRSYDKNNGAPDVTGADNGPDKIDLAAIESADDNVDLVEDALTARGAELVFWHIAAPDVAGHASGWLSSAYLDAVHDADDHIGQVLDVLDGDPDLADRTTILLTADHGGVRGARSHTDAASLADYRIPFIAWGRAVANGADLYDLNPDLSDPGKSRPDHAAQQPIRNTDVADTALELLGLPDVSESSGGIVLRAP